MNTKRLTRSRQDRMIAGVCGGIGRYLSIDPTLIRLAMLLLAIWGGGGILVYIIAWIVIPEEPLAEAAPMAPITPAEPAMPAEPMVESVAPADR
jgi:phage shock protein C